MAQAATIAAETLSDMGAVGAPDVAGEFVVGMWSDDVLPSADAVVAQVAQAAQKAQARQPSVHYSSSGGASPESQPKKKSKLPLVITAAVVVVLFAVYVVPRFIPHPHDPHEDTVLTSATAQGSSGTSAGASSAAVPSGSAESGVASSGAAESTGSATAAEPQASTGAPAASEASPASSESPTPQSFSTDERPELSEFTWLTGDAARGNVPAGATRLTEFADVEGGWKGYAYESNMERLLNVRIDSVQGGVAVTLDWYYLRIGGVSGEVREDDTPDMLFNGSWSAGAIDATGSGRVTIAAFWQHGDRQYAAGSFAWPDGTVSTLVLVRP